MRSIVATVVFAGLVGVTTAARATTVITESDFASGIDGWTGNATWSSTGGNSGGYAQFVSAGSAPSDIIAPAKFHGDWSALNGIGRISFDHALFALGADVGTIFPYSIEIGGPGGIARWNGPTPTQPTSWLSFLAPLDETFWSVSSGTWDGLLSNVQSFRIRIELVANPSGSADQAGIDNVRVGDAGEIPEPASFVALSIGAFLLFGASTFKRFRRRRPPQRGAPYARRASLHPTRLKAELLFGQRPDRPV